MWFEVPDDPHQRLRRHLDRLERETTLGQGRQRVALGQSGVHETQPGVLDAKDLLGLGHLTAADLGQIAQDLGVVLELRVEDVASLAAGA